MDCVNVGLGGRRLRDRAEGTTCIFPFKVDMLLYDVRRCLDTAVGNSIITRVYKTNETVTFSMVLDGLRGLLSIEASFTYGMSP